MKNGFNHEINYMDRIRKAKRNVDVLLARLNHCESQEDILNYVKDNLTADERIVVACGVFVFDDGKPIFYIPKTVKVLKKMTYKNIEKFEKGFTKVAFKEIPISGNPNIHRAIVDNYFWIPDNLSDEVKDSEEEDSE